MFADYGITIKDLMKCLNLTRNPLSKRLKTIDESGFLLCNRAGLQNFVYNDVPTYRRLTIEFLSSLQSTVKLWQGEDTISFCLMNNNYTLTLDEWCACFNLPNNDVHALRASFTGLIPSPDQYYNGIQLHLLAFYRYS